MEHCIWGTAGNCLHRVQSILKTALCIVPVTEDRYCFNIDMIYEAILVYAYCKGLVLFTQSFLYVANEVDHLPLVSSSSIVVFVLSDDS